ncbi:protein O-linked-mannose beta-1,4-N-acetylglucosaminyltransferase 2-like [Ptychodera flava]|uniref:protein O-linked-mannose beta-1,4-N-acetylglucosaminyltransferase 2-like n=1 Tax=Ptychodera flava TaxID=63121 RepID=UPI00396A3766
MHQIVFFAFGISLGVILHRYADQDDMFLERTAPSELCGCHGNCPLGDSVADGNSPTPSSPDPDVGREGSSVWCTGNNHTDRMCKFRNLCYAPHFQGGFIFFHGTDTVKQGFPKNRFDPALLDMTSVSDHNTQYFDFADLNSDDVYKFNVSFYHGNSFLFNRFNPENLMHVLHDDLLPLFVTLAQVTLSDSLPFDTNTRLLLMDGWPAGENFELYQVLSDKPVLLKQDLDKYPKGSLVCFRNAFVGLSKSSVWYQYGFSEPQGPLKDTTATATQIRHFTNFIRRRFDLSIGDEESGQYVVLLSRKINRVILNESEVMFALIQEFGLRVVAIGYETHSLKEQIQIISKASILIGVHGSLLTLSMFLPRWAIVIEIFPYAVNPENYTPYKTLTNLPGMNLVYRAWRNLKEENSVTHPDYPPHLGGIHHLPGSQQNEIMASGEVPLHLCCKDPEWLFRIYQDTFVDIPSFISTVEGALSNRNTLRSDQGRDSSHNDPLCPTKVGNLTCQIVNLDNLGNEMKTTNQKFSFNDEEPRSTNRNVGLKLSFEEPWNLPYLEARHIRYEVWIQESGEENYSAWLLPTTEYIFTENIKDNMQYYVWVRCVIDEDVQGPFTVATT